MRGDAAGGAKMDVTDRAGEDGLHLAVIRAETLGHRGESGERRTATVGILAVGAADTLADADELGIPVRSQRKMRGRSPAPDAGPD